MINIKSNLIIIFIILFVIFNSDICSSIQNQEYITQDFDSANYVFADFSDLKRLPPGCLLTIQYLDFKNTDVKDILRGLAEKYKLNVFVDDDVNLRITIHLTQISVYEAIKFIVDENGLCLKQQGNIFKISSTGCKYS